MELTVVMSTTTVIGSSLIKWWSLDTNFVYRRRAGAVRRKAEEAVGDRVAAGIHGDCMVEGASSQGKATVLTKERELKRKK